MSARHTRGPWETLPEEAGKAYIRVRGTRLGATYKIANVLVHTYPGDLDYELNEARANALLIAAAPELLAAVNGLLAYFESGNSVPVSQATIKATSPEVIAARAAIAKAGGEA